MGVSRDVEEVEGLEGVADVAHGFARFDMKPGTVAAMLGVAKEGDEVEGKFGVVVERAQSFAAQAILAKVGGVVTGGDDVGFHATRIGGKAEETLYYQNRNVNRKWFAIPSWL